MVAFDVQRLGYGYGLLACNTLYVISFWDTLHMILFFGHPVFDYLGHPVLDLVFGTSCI